VDVSARLINTLYEFIHGASHVGAGPRPALTFLDYADVDKLLLLSHSLGGYVAFSVLTGTPLEDPQHGSILSCVFGRSQHDDGMHASLC
jgi:hypothetical protein